MKLDLDAVDHDAATPLAAVHDVFQKWLGPAYDFQALDAVLATAAAEALPGDPPWLNVIAGPGWAKTETVAALEGAGARIVSTIVSDAALLSASIPTDKAKKKNPTPTGGLLKLLSAQARKILVLKDLTSVLSMDRTARAKVLAALREIYDGAWDRNVGSDGGRSIAWRGGLCSLGRVPTIGIAITRSSRRWAIGSSWCGCRPIRRLGRNPGRKCARTAGTKGRCVAPSGTPWPASSPDSTADAIRGSWSPSGTPSARWPTW